MHKFLKFQGSSLYNYSRESFSLLNKSTNSCLLCKQNNSFNGVFRYNSTKVNISPRVQKYKKKRKTYTDILIVTNNSSKQSKAYITKLTFSDLELLANTNLNLSELHKLKQLSQEVTANEYTYNNLNITENFPEISSTNKNDFINLNTNSDKVVNIEMPQIKLQKNQQQEQVEEVSEFSTESAAIEDELDSIKMVDTFQPEIPDSEIDDTKGPPDKFLEKTSADRGRKEEVATQTVASYIELCNHMKNPQRGFNALNFHRYNRKKFQGKSYIPLKNSDIYNTLLKGFANKGDYSKIKEILDIMKEENIEFTLKTYVTILECIGRNDPKLYKDELNMHVKDALSKNISFDQIMNEGIFLNLERTIVLNAIKRYSPEYSPTYKTPVIIYNNHLVNSLNHSDHTKEFVLKTSETPGIFQPSKMEKYIQKQLDLEKGGYITIKSIESKGPITEEIKKYRVSLEEHYTMWEDEALKAFNRDLATLTAHRSALNMEPYIRSIPAKDCVAIILEEAKKIAQGSETYSPTVNMLYKGMGSKVYARYKILCKQKSRVIDKIMSIHTSYCQDYAIIHSALDVVPSKENIINPRQNWQLIEHKFKGIGATLDMGHQDWPLSALTFIGKFLYRIVMYDLKVNVNALRNSSHKNYLPAFYTIFRTQSRIVKEEVKPHPVLSKLYRKSCPETLTFPSYEVPMVCPPVPWISIDTGGYLISPCEVIRLPSQALSQKLRIVEAGAQQMFPSLDALNQLASIPWTVNGKILDIVLEIFNKGGSSQLDIPEQSSSLTPPPMPTPDMDKAMKYQLFKQKLQYRRKKAEMYSLWCDCLYRLSLANHFRNEVFWLPHNMDFRGRVYPVPPHLNHLGSDLARSLLIFAEGRPLGPKGLDWLKIHLINLTGLKKMNSIDKRLEYANEIMDLILDSADYPLTGKRWWAESDEPWQTLACCMEIANVVRSPDPDKFVSRFPVHQDGSCNGLQHYAALGRDAAGAFSVNLSASDVPQDVYSAVVSLVEKERMKDAKNGSALAKALEGFVKRKVIKQTIMTTVYGVTRFGARLQIARQLKDIDEFPKDLVWGASSYLTGRTFDALKTMFTSTREIQDWFTECARLISSVGAQHVEWVTPLGLPIVQPYIKFTKRTSNAYDSFNIDKFEKPNVMKQKNAFPPNFIHSLDSSHMMLTSLHCERAGITFVSVHDCYWTHPSTVHIMNKICREQFVALHSEPILENLSKFLTERFSYNEREFTGDGSVIDLTKKKLNRILRKTPKTGDFDINEVLKSVYFFS